MEITKLREQTRQENKEEFALEVLKGLSSEPKKISSKYFYDDRGSELFQSITKHPDYYLTRAEFEILKNLDSSFFDSFKGKTIDLVELGSGDGHKSFELINGFLRNGIKVQFFPIDISQQAIQLLEETFSKTQSVNIHAIVADYFTGLRYLKDKSRNPKLILFLGSNIGNFDYSKARIFLKSLQEELSPEDHLLIGFDLKKDLKSIEKAYSDSSGLTRDFNLNLLSRINRELGGDFSIGSFSHHSFYNPSLGAMESYLISLKEQSVYLADLEKKFDFKEYEPIHLEYSFKYSNSDIDQMSLESGFSVVDHFSSSSRLFVDSLWKVQNGEVRC